MRYCIRIVFAAHCDTYTEHMAACEVQLWCCTARLHLKVVILVYDVIVEFEVGPGLRLDQPRAYVQRVVIPAHLDTRAVVRSGLRRQSTQGQTALLASGCKSA